jgi:hypothetical protein
MRFKKVLLYPFSAETSYFESYAWAVELASRMNAHLQLFTTTWLSGNLSFTRDRIYHSLLEAQGYYLEHYRRESNQTEIKSEPYITDGDLTDELVSHLRKNTVDVVVLDPAFMAKHHRKLGEIVEASGGVIALPAGKRMDNDVKSDYFYDILRKAELYKLPENFFSTLGKDQAVFNYLRRIFQKKTS